MGMFKANKATGFGKFYHKAGDYFFGEFVFDRARGYGIYLHSNGAEFEGEWVDDFQEGYGKSLLLKKGVEKWLDKSYYIGKYNRGKKDGYGIYEWGDGSSYTGEWKENCLHGYVLIILVYIREAIFLQTDECTSGLGFITKWKATGNFIGKTVKSTLDTTQMTRKKGLEFTTGRNQQGLILVFGKKVSSMG